MVGALGWEGWAQFCSFPLILVPQTSICANDLCFAESRVLANCWLLIWKTEATSSLSPVISATGVQDSATLSMTPPRCAPSLLAIHCFEAWRLCKVWLWSEYMCNLHPFLCGAGPNMRFHSMARSSWSRGHHSGMHACLAGMLQRETWTTVVTLRPCMRIWHTVSKIESLPDTTLLRYLWCPGRTRSFQRVHAGVLKYNMWPPSHCCAPPGS